MKLLFTVQRVRMERAQNKKESRCGRQDVEGEEADFFGEGETVLLYDVHTGERLCPPVMSYPCSQTL
jgi:hypothetical protein